MITDATSEMHRATQDSSLPVTKLAYSALTFVLCKKEVLQVAFRKKIEKVYRLPFLLRELLLRTDFCKVGNPAKEISPRAMPLELV